MQSNNQKSVLGCGMQSNHRYTACAVKEVICHF
jgi:hypothetical protein